MSEGRLEISNVRVARRDDANIGASPKGGMIQLKQRDQQQSLLARTADVLWSAPYNLCELHAGQVCPKSPRVSRHTCILRLLRIYLNLVDRDWSNLKCSLRSGMVKTGSLYSLCVYFSLCLVTSEGQKGISSF